MTHTKGCDPTPQWKCLRFHCCRTRICRKNYCIGIDFKHLLLRVFVCVRESNSSQPRRRRTAVVAKGSFLGAFCVFFNAFLIQFLANPSILFAAANWAVQQRSPRRQIAAELPHAELARIVRPFLSGASWLVLISPHAICSSITRASAFLVSSMTTPKFFRFTSERELMLDWHTTWPILSIDNLRWKIRGRMQAFWEPSTGTNISEITFVKPSPCAKSFSPFFLWHSLEQIRFKEMEQQQQSAALLRARRLERMVWTGPICVDLIFPHNLFVQGHGD